MNAENELIKPLDPVLVQRANGSSTAFNFGDSIVQKYKENVIEIGKMQHLDNERKTKAINMIYVLQTDELSSQGKAIGAYTYGPAVVNTKKDANNFDAAIDKRLTADKFMNTLRTNEQKHIIAKRHSDLVKTLHKANEQGQCEISIDGKTFYKSGKTWTTKKPLERNSKGRSR